MDTSSWPLDSPKALGASAACALCFAAGAWLYSAAQRRAQVDEDWYGDLHGYDLLDTVASSMAMAFATLIAFTVLYFSWIRSNNRRYDFLDAT